jgi:hypothetical protein
MISIYMLTDPTGADTCYVGSTQNPARRMKQHLADLVLPLPQKWDLHAFRVGQRRLQPPSRKMRWFKMLHDRGLAPIMHILVTVPESERVKAETDAIGMVKAVRGEHLVNEVIPRLSCSACGRAYN